jgi:hypothetical protein
MDLLVTYKDVNKGENLHFMKLYMGNKTSQNSNELRNLSILNYKLNHLIIYTYYCDYF